MVANDNGVEEASSILDSIRMFATVLAGCMTTESKSRTINTSVKTKIGMVIV